MAKIRYTYEEDKQAALKKFLPAVAGICTLKERQPPPDANSALLGDPKSTEADCRTTCRQTLGCVGYEWVAPTACKLFTVLADMIGDGSADATCALRDTT